MTNTSQSLFERGMKVLVEGVSSASRGPATFGGAPRYMSHGQGARLYDVDGREYVDWMMAFGALPLGHAYPKVVEAIAQVAKRGTSFGAPTEMESRMAELIISMVPSMEMVRMVNSGTEATMSAIRLARGYTGRDIIIKFAGCYHGHVDSLLVQAGSAATTLGVPSSPGVPKGCTQDTLVLKYNDVEGLKAAFAQHPDKIACVILEPVVGNMGLIPPSKEFLQELRSLTRNSDSVLILDEVMTGFRLAMGGAQELLGIEPDLTALGKIVGGGLPVGAYGGKKEIMSKVMPSGPVYQAGTLSGNPLAMAAGLATLEELKKNPPYKLLDATGAKLEAGLSQAAKTAGIPHVINRVGSMWTFFFTSSPVVDYDTAKNADTKRFSRFFWEMMDRGVYLPCSQFEAAFHSIQHDQTIIEKTIVAARESFEVIAKSGI